MVAEVSTDIPSLRVKTIENTLQNESLDSNPMESPKNREVLSLRVKRIKNAIRIKSPSSNPTELPRDRRIHIYETS